MDVGYGLVLAAVLAAWLPVETAPWAGAATVLVLALSAVLADRPAGVRYRGPAVAGGLAALVWVGAGLFTGWDRASACAEIGLAAAVTVAFWLASGRPVRERALEMLSAGIAGLAVWELWQVAHGFSADLGNLAALPTWMQPLVRQRILTGRAFASFSQPGHLAALLATLVPVGVSRVAAGRRRPLWLAVLAAAAAGIVLSRSLLGAGLAVLGVALGWPGRRGTAWRAAVAVAVGGILIVILLRTDLGRLEPVRQRLDNWRAAVWVWESSPVSGAGLGGFGQAALAYPGPAANRPRHAHDLPLEWLAEMGLPGLGLGLLFLGWCVLLARRAWAADRGLAAALLILPAHNLLDFSLFAWGAALPWGVLAGWAYAAGRPGPEGRNRGRFPRPLVAACGAVLVAVAGCNAAGAAFERRAREASGAGEAFRLAERARAVAPWRMGSLPVLAAAPERDPALLAPAIAGLERARRWVPHSPGIALLQARLLLLSGDRPAAAARVQEALALAPPGSALATAARVLAARIAGNPK